MRRERSPSRLHPSEHSWSSTLPIIVCDAARQYLALPGWREPRNLAAAAATSSMPRSPSNLRARRNMLPAQQPAHESGRRYRLDLLAQRSQRQTVDARQQPPLAPFALPDSTASRNLPRRMAPLASRRNRALYQCRAAAMPSASQLLGDVTGPECASAIRHRSQRSLRVAGSAVHIRQGAGNPRSGRSSGTFLTLSAATQYDRSRSSPLALLRRELHHVALRK